MNKNNRSGSVLLFVIITIGVIIGMVSLSVGYAYNRARLIAAEEARYSLRNKALNVLSQVMWNINADTNGFDCAVEGSMASRVIDGCEITIEPANARFNFSSFPSKRFVELVPALVPEDVKDADKVAQAIEDAWVEAMQLYGEQYTLNAIEELYGFSRLGNADPLIFESIFKYFTVYRYMREDQKLNLNMVHLYMLPYLASANNVEAMQAFQERLKLIREKDLFFVGTDALSAKAVLLEASQSQSFSQLDALLLMSLANSFTVASDDFYITIVARDAASSYRIECVYERGTGKIKRWVE